MLFLSRLLKSLPEPSHCSWGYTWERLSHLKCLVNHKRSLVSVPLPRTCHCTVSPALPAPCPVLCPCCLLALQRSLDHQCTAGTLISGFGISTWDYHQNYPASGKGCPDSLKLTWLRDPDHPQKHCHSMWQAVMFLYSISWYSVASIMLAGISRFWL